MRSVGMIAEFNPLHNGHVHALSLARQQANADVVVVVMSGNYVQRGEPAIVDKWARTDMALHAGADVVVELPVNFAVQAGQQFAEGGIALLKGLQVDTIAFGTENPELDFNAIAAKRIAAEASGSGDFADYTQTYASQLTEFYAHEVGMKLTAPNTMLALAYAEANLRAGKPMQLLPIRRVGAQHDADGTDAVFSSGSALRKLLRAGASIHGQTPDFAEQLLLTNAHFSWHEIWPLLAYRLQTATLPELRTIDQMSEGLEYRLVKAAQIAGNFDAFLRAVKSKRYTYARLRRLALATVLNMTQAEVTAARMRPIAHVLGFTTAGQEFLHSIKKTAGVPIITKVSHDMLAPTGPMYLTHRSDALYRSFTGRDQNFGRKPLMLHN